MHTCRVTAVRCAWQRAGNAEVVAALSGTCPAPPPPTVAEWKTRGNEAFKRKEYTAAIGQYSEAITALAVGEDVLGEAALYSNRSACHAAGMGGV